MVFDSSEKTCLFGTTKDSTPSCYLFHTKVEGIQLILKPLSIYWLGSRATCDLSDQRTTLLPEAARPNASFWLKALTKCILPAKPSKMICYAFLSNLMCVLFTNNAAFIIGWLHKQSFNSTSPKNCDVKHVIAVVLLIERSTFSSSGPTVNLLFFFYYPVKH